VGGKGVVLGVKIGGGGKVYSLKFKLRFMGLKEFFI
jgi:hypothetical protein